MPAKISDGKAIAEQIQDGKGNMLKRINILFILKLNILLLLFFFTSPLEA